ncbi:anaerobic ribonucleoside triphosphate reductase [Spiroplasma diminutum]|uniref:Anaerobic ribonucleoside-triphosphate reductase n=1 Tax=Spiroplasma diminutum CUAS-1 TaxID=1276221 RepID=S5M031_9MOLU|nr:anaerobic ribonucleoside triphosphate reductase [Spiroplasma diminutum]AGR42191.1 anaerobic ribonucleoside-triphosphate reductase [Spiroplasma diminutum CUAS-1]
MNNKKLNSDKILKDFNQAISISNNDVKNENANMNGNTPSGKMMKFASITSKEYALENLLKPFHAELHNKSLIHIHDLDYYPTKSATCVQYNIQEIFSNGFRTRNGLIREPQSIQVYAELAAIVFQTAQNEMHGGQSIPAFDYFMAPGVNKSFRKALIKNLKNFFIFSEIEFNEDQLNKIKLDEEIKFKSINKSKLEVYLTNIKLTDNDFEKIFNITNKDVIQETDQAMKGFIYNLNTQHSRGGNQVVFSSINIGTDTSKEGRQVTKSLLKALQEGLGNGETSIFPIVIFKVKTGINFDENDYKKAMNMNQEDWFNDNNIWNAKNFDLFLNSIRTTSLRLFPNFMFLDQEYNTHELWKENSKNSWYYEPATMGCRTRVFENINGDKTSIGRGNLSFTSLNLPYIALELLKEENKIINNEIDFNSINKKEIKDKYLEKVKFYSQEVCDQLLERFNYQSTALAKEFPFLMMNNILTGGKDLEPQEFVKEVFKQGTLTIGFVGLAEALKALLNFHHGENDEAQNFGLEILKVINEVALEWKQKTHLNFGVIATPAESVAGRMMIITKKHFGEINEITSREYFTNSNHIPVYYNISAINKIKKEAAYHSLTLAGSISYIELDGEAKKNLHAVLSIINAMRVYGINYGSLNHPVDRCKECNYTSLIPFKCQMCGNENISRTRRITGYLVGDLDGWNKGKQAEEAERVKHKINN